jgi:hypothetical protein
MPSHYLENIFINIARGIVAGTEVRNIFGTTDGSASIGTLDYQTPWELPQEYVFPVSASLMDLVSDNAADTSVLIKLVGLNDSYEEITETVQLAGLTPVTTTIPFFRINDAITVAGNAIGNVDISAGGTTYSHILAGAGRDQKSVFTVPLNTRFYLFRIDAFCTDANGGKAAQFQNKLTTSSGVTLRVANTTFFDQMSITRVTPYQYAQKTDINLELKSLSGSVYGSIFAEGVLVKL